jgi:hypothetical protein
MSSQKQIEANRLNSRKSTGPRSAEGKSRSSMNALKSGIDAKSQVIRGEKAANLDALKTEYYGRFHPTTPETRMLVDTLIDAEWLLRRFRVCEAQLWEQGAQFAMTPDDDIELAQGFRGNYDCFERLQRRIDTGLRNYHKALHELERLQAAEARDPDPQPTLATPRNQSAKPPNGFVPPTRPEDPIDPPPAPSRTVVNRERDAQL